MRDETLVVFVEIWVVLMVELFVVMMIEMIAMVVVHSVGIGKESLVSSF